MIASILTIIAFISLSAALLYKKIFDYWKVRGVPHIKPQFIYGCAKGLDSKYHMVELLPRIYEGLKNQGPFCGFYIGFRPTAIIMELDLIRNVLVKDFENFRNRGFYYNPVDDPMAAHISNIENDQWKDMKPTLTPAFTCGKVKASFKTILGISDNLLKMIDRDSPTGSIEVNEIMSRFTCDVMGHVIFGIECNSLINRTEKLYDISLMSMNTPYTLFQTLFLEKFTSLARFFHLKVTPDYMYAFFNDMVGSIVNYRKQNENQKRSDLMNILITAMKKGIISMDQVTAHSYFYFFVGTETPASSLTFCLYELSLNQEIQEKARQEVLQVMSKYENQLTYEACDELKFVDKIIKETLRKWPISVKTQRKTTADFKIPNTNFVIEKGCIIVVPIYAIHHDPAIYPDPEKFDPSRFDHEEVVKRHPFAYLPFGDGPRVCPGLRFSNLEMKIVLARLLMTYQFSLDYDLTRMPIKISPVIHLMRPNDGVFVKFDKLY